LDDSKNLEKELEHKFQYENGIYKERGDTFGYWSNLNIEENKDLLDWANKNGAEDAIRNLQPNLYDVIFSPKREAGLELLELRGDEVCIDYGCMWGALTVPLAKRCKSVISVDQTLESLQFLQTRLNDEKLKNVTIINHNLRTFPELSNEAKVDVAVVNGVLEWVPEIGPVELKKFYGKREKRNYNRSYNPKEVQIEFLKKIRSNLKSNGKLYLAIENRYDFKMFLGIKDPHSNLHLTTVLPKKIANLISKLVLGRPYVNWIYSKDELIQLLEDAGYSEVQLSIAFPDYRFPDYIQDYKKSVRHFEYKSNIRDAKQKLSVKRLIARTLEKILFFFLGLKYFSPSFIVIAKK
jgi:hypothetical protein